MTVTDVAGGTYYNMLSISPLFKNGQFNPPATNLFRANNLIGDAVVQAANDKMGHTGSYGVYAGTGGEFIKVGGYRTASTVAWGTFKDDISIFSDASIVPKDNVDLSGAEWLAQEQAEKANYLGQSIENHLLYGTNGPTADTRGGVTATSSPEKYTGLGARYRVPDASDPIVPTGTGAQKGVWDAEGSGTDTTSIWFIRWGKRAVSLITPSNDPQFGLQIRDLGLEKQWSGATYREVYMKQFEWKHGLSIYPGSNGGNHVARLRNIESALSYNNSGLKALIFQIIEEYFLNDTEGVMMYVPPRINTICDILFESKGNVEFTRANPYELAPKSWSGKVFMRTCRAISIAETAVTAV